MKQEVLMRSVILVLLAIVLLTGLPALAQRNQVTVSFPRTVREVRRDFTLEQAALARNHRLTGLLQPGAKAKIDLASQPLLAHLATDPENADPYALAQQEICSKFPQLSSEQCNLLSFYVLAEVARILSDPEELKGLEGMNEMSEMTSLRLQMLIRQKVEVHQHAQRQREEDLHHPGHADPKH